MRMSSSRLQINLTGLPTAFEISAGVECRILGVDLNDATRRVAAEQCSLRAFENIDAGNGA